MSIWITPCSVCPLSFFGVWVLVWCSKSSKNCLAGRPPEYPVNFPFLPTTLWQGMKIANGFFALVVPTALQTIELMIFIVWQKYGVERETGSYLAMCHWFPDWLCLPIFSKRSWKLNFYNVHWILWNFKFEIWILFIWKISYLLTW